MTPFRDRIVCVICNWLLNHVASAHYRAMVGGSIRYGLMAAARDTHGGQPPMPRPREDRGKPA